LITYYVFSSVSDTKNIVACKQNNKKYLPLRFAMGQFDIYLKLYTCRHTHTDTHTYIYSIM
jgi:hypothetical protein